MEVQPLNTDLGVARRAFEGLAYDRAVPSTCHKSPAVTLLTGGFDRPYVSGLTTALLSRDISLEVIGSDEIYGPEMDARPDLRFLSLHKTSTRHDSAIEKALKLLRFYVRLLGYSLRAKPRIFHILWNNKIQFFDRTVLMLYYRMLGKKVVLTAHNVNAGRRDGSDSWYNRLTLKVQYSLADHIFLHTEEMKKELMADFRVKEQAISVIPFGINDSIAKTEMTPRQAKQTLGISEDHRVLLFFGNIGPYKGLEFLVAAFELLAARDDSYRLLIAGKARGGCREYVDQIQRRIRERVANGQIIARIEYIPDNETEVLFKAADVLILPYVRVAQSGVLFLGYSFGLPVIASDIASFREDIVEGKTGFLCRPGDPADLAAMIERYFRSDLFRNLDCRRAEIRDHAERRHSWDDVADLTRDVYVELLMR